MKRSATISVVCVLLLLLSCSGSGEGSEYVNAMPAEEEAPAPMPPSEASGLQGLGTRGAGKSAPSAARTRDALNKLYDSAAVDQEFGGRKAKKQTGKQASDDQVELPKPRLVHYNGYLRVKHTIPSQTLQQASEIADAAGGYVETLTATTVTLRVPVAAFRDVYHRLATIAEVLERSMSAHDVTDAYYNTQLRTKTLKASRDRLIALLKQAQRPQEKLRLLREIMRLTEKIDRLEMELTALASLASFSRLTVEVVPRQAHVASAAAEPVAAFRWIAELSPFKRSVARQGRTLNLDKVPAGLVKLTEKDVWIAESADGAVLWASQRENQPAGDTDFWLEALRSRFERYYGNAEVQQFGPWQAVRVVDPSEVAYRYLVGVRVHQGNLQLFELYYPTPEHEQRYEEAISLALAGGAS